MRALDRAFDIARGRDARAVFPETGDPVIDAAAARLRAEGLARPLPPPDSADAALQARLLAALVDERGLREAVARRMLARPLFAAAAMVAAGEADVLVAGIATPTRKVIEAAALTIGLAPGNTTPSSFFLMAFPDGRDLVFADCAVTVAPDAAQLADIARASAVSGEALLGAARPALLSYATGTSGTGPSVETVREAARLSGLPGPLQADAALDPAIAARKGAGDTAGDANVLVFPDLDAGNIAYKLCRSLAGARAIGPVLQGFARPVCDLSRGAEADEIVAATAVTVALG